MGWFFEDRVERLTDAQLRNRTKCRKKKQKIKKQIRAITKHLDDMLIMFVIGLIVVFATSIILLT